MDLKAAEKYFKKMGCSHFHMDREDRDQYTEYKKLGISKDLEKNWKLEAYTCYSIEILDTETPKNELWMKYSRMAKLAEDLSMKKKVNDLLQTSKELMPLLSKKTKIMVVETILGRNAKEYKSGLVFLSLDLGQKETALSFLEIANDLTSSNIPASQTARYLEANKNYFAIKRKIRFQMRFKFW